MSDIAPVEAQSGELISDSTTDVLRHALRSHVPSQPRRVTIANRTSQSVSLLGVKVTRGFQIGTDSLTFGDGSWRLLFLQTGSSHSM